MSLYQVSLKCNRILHFLWEIYCFSFLSPHFCLQASVWEVQLLKSVNFQPWGWNYTLSFLFFFQHLHQDKRARNTSVFSSFFLFYFWQPPQEQKHHIWTERGTDGGGCTCWLCVWECVSVWVCKCVCEQAFLPFVHMWSPQLRVSPSVATWCRFLQQCERCSSEKVQHTYRTCSLHTLYNRFKKSYMNQIEVL